MTKGSFHSLFEVGLGIDLNHMEKLSDEGTIFAKAFDDANELVFTRFFYPVIWELQRFLNIGSEAVFKKNVKIVDNFVYNVINTKRELLAMNPDCVSPSYIIYALNFLLMAYLIKKKKFTWPFMLHNGLCNIKMTTTKKNLWERLLSNRLFLKMPLIYLFNLIINWVFFLWFEECQRRYTYKVFRGEQEKSATNDRQISKGHNFEHHSSRKRFYCCFFVVVLLYALQESVDTGKSCGRSDKRC